MRWFAYCFLLTPHRFKKIRRVFLSTNPIMQIPVPNHVYIWSYKKSNEPFCSCLTLEENDFTSSGSNSFSYTKVYVSSDGRTPLQEEVPQKHG